MEWHILMRRMSRPEITAGVRRAYDSRIPNNLEVTMRGRLGLMIGFGAGYVLGAKAGTERYEQLRRLYDNLLSTPQFRQASGKAREVVDAGLDQAKDIASGGVSKVAGAVKGRDSHPTNLSVAPPPSD